MQKLFIEEFIMHSDAALNQTPNLNSNQANIALTGKFNLPQNPLDNAKKQVQLNHEMMLKQLKEKWGMHHDYTHVN